MRIQLMLGILVTATSCMNAVGFPKEPAEYAVWEKRKLIEAQEISEKPPDEAIPELSLWLYQLSQSRNRELQSREVYPAVRNALLSIPGHATYYEKRIKELSDAYFDAPESPKLGALASHLVNHRMHHFQMLKLMPSPEAVRVLGDLLYDDRGSIPGTRGYHEVPYHSIGSNSIYALQSLAALPIESKPLQPRKGNAVIHEQDIDAWRLWYEQVKAGTRTFRFEGNPQNYSLSGPVAEARTPSPGKIKPRSDLPDGLAEREGSQPLSRSSEGRSGPWWWVGGGLLLVLCFAWSKRGAK